MRKTLRKIRRKSIRQRKTKTYKGGVSFNSPMNFNDIPKPDYYTLNSYDDDTSRAPWLQDARLLQNGGGRRRQNKSHNKKKMRGGGVLEYSIFNSGNMGTVTAFNTTTGASEIVNTINGTSNDNNSGPTNMYPQVVSTMV